VWGDSRAQSWEFGAAFPGASIQVFAHGGQTSAQVLLQLKSSRLPRARISIVQVGINDLHPFGALYSNPPDARRAVSKLIDNIREIRDSLMATSNLVVLTTVFPPGHVPPVRMLLWDPNTLGYLAQVNDSIRAMAIPGRVWVFEANSVLADRDGFLAIKYVDKDFFLHVNSAAYADLTRALSAGLHAGSVNAN
jgi:hypothetical protein